MENISKELIEHYKSNEVQEFMNAPLGDPNMTELKARSNGNAGYKEPAEDTLLTECCKALGWQGGTIHQIKQILIKAKKVKQAYETMQMPQSDNDDVEKFKAAMAELIYVFHKY